MIKNIAQIVVGLPVDGPFDYAVPESLRARIQIGHRVMVKFAHQSRMGYIVGFLEKSSIEKLNVIDGVPDAVPVLSDEMLRTTKIFSTYYGCSWGEAVETVLPDYLKQTRKVHFDATGIRNINTVSVKRVLNQKSNCRLMYGSDREDIWTQLKTSINDALNQRKSVILLLPEVAWVEKIFHQHFKNAPYPVFVYDGKITSKEEFELWNKIRREEFCLVIGSRKTVFTPANHLQSIMIVDEDHIAYKQDQTPFYHVYEAALIRQKIEPFSLVLTSSVPRVEIWYQSNVERWNVSEHTSKNLSEIKIVDLTNYKYKYSGCLSVPLQNHINQHVKEGKKILLLLNRKGASSLTVCQQCGYILKCPRCEVRLTLSHVQKKLQCNRCQYQADLPTSCPQCRRAYLRSIGTGIEKVRNDLMKFNAGMKIVVYEQKMEKIPADVQVVVATQSILNVEQEVDFEMVALLDFDQEVNRADYKSHRNIFSLLINLRALAKKELMIQTTTPDHFILKYLKNMDYESFYQDDLKFRRELDLPPYQRLTAVCLRGREEKKVFEESTKLLKILSDQGNKNITLSDVHADVYPKWRDKYRYTISLKAQTVPEILEAVKPAMKLLKKKKDIVATINVDP